MRRAIVSGATGFLGYHLVRELTKHGIMVYALYRPGTANLDRLRGADDVKPVPCAMEMLGELPEICEEREFDAFYHLAWQGSTGQERERSQVQTDNIKWTVEAAGAAARLKCRKFVATGTVCENQCTTIAEKGTLSTAAFYLLAKEAAYKMTKIECMRNNLPLVWCTFYHPIGKYNKPDQIIAGTILKMLRGEEPQFGPADKWFDIIAAEDLCRGLYLAGKETLKNDRYFIGSGNPRRLREYLEEVKAVMGSKIPLRFGVYPDDGLPVNYGWLKDTAFHEETGFYTQITLKESIERLLAWMQCNRIEGGQKDV